MPADKKPPINTSNVEYIEDFSSGLNTTISPTLLNKNEAQIAEDVSFEQKGTIVPRKGRRKRYATTFSPSPTSGLGMLYKQDGTSLLVVTSDTTLYYDKPREGLKWTTKAEWDDAVMNDYVSTSMNEGSLTMKLGNKDGVSSFNGTRATSGDKTFTYGRLFTVNKLVKVFKVRFIPRQADATYSISLWEGFGTNKLLKNVTKVSVSADVGNWTEVQFAGSPITLELGKAYMLGISCPKDNGLDKYADASTLSPEFTLTGTFTKNTVDTYPTTATTGDIAVDIGYEINEWQYAFDPYTKGTKSGVVVNGNTLTLVKEDMDANDVLSGGTLAGVVYDTVLRLASTLTWRSLGKTYWNEI